MNDDDAIVEIGYSPDHIIKDPGHVVPDYSYRIVKSGQYTQDEGRDQEWCGRDRTGAGMRMPGFAWFENNRGEAHFHKGRIALTIGPDGA